MKKYKINDLVQIPTILKKDDKYSINSFGSKISVCNEIWNNVNYNCFYCFNDDSSFILSEFIWVMKVKETRLHPKYGQMIKVININSRKCKFSNFKIDAMGIYGNYFLSEKIKLFTGKVCQKCGFVCYQNCN